MPTYQLPTASELEGKRLSRVLVDAKLADSATEARRLINQGAVQIDGEKVSEDGDASALKPGSILRAGRRRFAKLT